MTKSVFVVALASGFLLTVLSARAEEPASNIDVLPTLYVGKFQPVEHASNGFGPLHALNSDIHRLKADSNAARLSSALVEALRKLQAQADPCPRTRPFDPMPVG
jgi:hypothetical protein